MNLLRPWVRIAQRADSLVCAQTWRDGAREFGGVYTARA
jgi:hypothetical protein